MIIVYASIALFVAALVYLGYSAFKTMKDVKPALKSIQDTTGRIQQRTDRIKNEMNRLTVNQQLIAQDVQQKKQVVQGVVDSVKDTKRLIKQLWDEGKSIPFSQRKKNRQPSEIEIFGEKVMSMWRKWKIGASTRKRLTGKNL